MMQQSRARRLPRFGFALLAALLSLMICSKSSFLYPMNDWVDVNCFFTVGRGILHGLMPYRDLYEQKGPLLYLIFALAGLCSETSFLGVFLVECACFACFLYIAGHLVELLSGLQGAFCPFAAVLALVIPLSPAFSHGASAEELFLPVFLAALWMVLSAMRAGRPLSLGEGVGLGLCTAAALWTKYTFCAFFVGLAVSVLVWYLASRMLRAFPRLLLGFLIGFMVPGALLVGWFALQGAADSLWQVYFLDNLTRYGQSSSAGPSATPLQSLLSNPTWVYLAAGGLLWMVCALPRHAAETAACLLSAGCLLVGTYINGHRYPYYALVLAAFAPLGIAALCRLILRLGTPRRWMAVSLTALVLCASPFVCLRLSGNVYLMAYEREDLPQYRFAALIRQAEDQTLLNDGFLDGGFYFAAQVQPSSRFFCQLNISLPEMTAAQQRSIRNGETAFVVTRQQELRKSNAYRLVDSCRMVFEGRSWTYYLYQRIDQ